MKIQKNLENFSKNDKTTFRQANSCLLRYGARNNGRYTQNFVHNTCNFSLHMIFVFTKYYRRLYAMFSGNSSCSQLIGSPHIGLQSDLIFHAVMAYLVLYHFHMLWPFQSQVYLCMETSFSVSVFETISGI